MNITSSRLFAITLVTGLGIGVSSVALAHVDVGVGIGVPVSRIGVMRPFRDRRNRATR
ncbi:putative ferredoxin-like protein [Paraburkholderia sp. GAS32]